MAFDWLSYRFMRSPLATVTPRNAVMTRLFSELVTDALQEYAYDAELAGLRYSFDGLILGAQISLSGYNDKIPILLRKVLETVRNLKVDPERLEVIREQLKLEYQNFSVQQPYMISTYWMRYTLQERAWTHAEKLAELPCLSTLIPGLSLCSSLNSTIILCKDLNTKTISY